MGIIQNDRDSRNYRFRRKLAEKNLYELGEIPPLGHVPKQMYAWAIRKERHGDPCMSEVFAWEDIPAAHTKMLKNLHKPGNMPVLGEAKRPGRRTVEDCIEG